jgi:hypothetical protein
MLRLSALWQMLAYFVFFLFLGFSGSLLVKTARGESVVSCLHKYVSY